MKKIFTVLFVIVSMSILPSFLKSAAKTPVDFDKINKAISLFKEAAVLENEGKSVKGERKRNEAHKILDKIFKPGKTITVGENCNFIKTQYKSNIFEFSCGELEDGGTLTFEFNTMWDLGSGDKNLITSDSVLEKYEDSDGGFTGKIKFLEGDDSLGKHVVSIYDLGSKYIHLKIHCKIVSLKPLN